jgi:hypothetical protein
MRGILATFVLISPGNASSVPDSRAYDRANLLCVGTLQAGHGWHGRAGTRERSRGDGHDAAGGLCFYFAARDRRLPAVSLGRGGVAYRSSQACTKRMYCGTSSVD